MKANNLPEGRILYISKDDLTLAEFPVYLKDKKLEELLQKDIKEMSYYVLNKQEPPKPPNIMFNPRAKLRFQKDKKKIVIDGCYELNWEVLRSPWFIKITGFKNKEDWESKVKSELFDKNNEIKENYIKELENEENNKRTPF